MSALTTDGVPTQFELMWPTVEALRDLGGFATIGEISDEVVRREGGLEPAMVPAAGP